MRAVFKGQDGSMGFHTGFQYSLDSRISNNQLIIMTPQVRVPYVSLEAFLENWDIINEPNLPTRLANQGDLGKRIVRILNSSNVRDVAGATGVAFELLDKHRKAAQERGGFIEVSYYKGNPLSVKIVDEEGAEIV